MKNINPAETSKNVIFKNDQKEDADHHKLDNRYNVRNYEGLQSLDISKIHPNFQ